MHSHSALCQIDLRSRSVSCSIEPPESLMSTATTRTRKPRAEPLRFAHPFYTDTPPEARVPTAYGKRMLDHIQGTLQPIPKPSRDPVMTLADIVGTKGA